MIPNAIKCSNIPILLILYQWTKNEFPAWTSCTALSVPSKGTCAMSRALPHRYHRPTVQPSQQNSCSQKSKLNTKTCQIGQWRHEWLPSQHSNIPIRFKFDILFLKNLLMQSKQKPALSLAKDDLKLLTWLLETKASSITLAFNKLLHILWNVPSLTSIFIQMNCGFLPQMKCVEKRYKQYP